MGTSVFRFRFLAVVVLLAGCSSSPVPAPEPEELPPDLSPATLLTRPRAQLAELADEWATKIRIQEKALREGTLAFNLLPDLRLPLAVPVWREAQYSALAGFSLPPYLAEGAKDTDLALHLARFGDTEAARRLVASSDAEALRQIEAACYERDYPLEWTRLMGLLLHAAQVHLALGEPDGAKELAGLHRQLVQVLDPKAARGPLGRVLLARGRDVLARSEAAWRANERADLAEQAKAELAAWDEVAAPPLPLRPGSPRAEVSRLLHSPSQGRLVSAGSVARALDVWALPFPDQGAEALFACFDEADRLTDLFLTYRAGQGEHFRKPAGLAHLWEEQGVAKQDGPKSAGLERRLYQVGDWTGEVLVVTHGAGVGAVVHLGDGRERRAARLVRDFGAVHLDRSFEQNRLRLVPEQRGAVLLTGQPEALAQLVHPLAALKPAGAQLEQTPGHNLTAALRLNSPGDVIGTPALPQLTLPLWATAGPPSFHGVEDPQGGHLALVWDDARTRYTLELPYEVGQPVGFEAADRYGPGQLAERAAFAAALDRAERQARLAAGKPLVRLPRDLEQLELGMTRARIAQGLPVGQAVQKRTITGGLAATFTSEPAGTESTVLRQLVIRFDRADRAVELLARYTDGPAARRGGGDLLASLRRRGGAARELPAADASLWTELPPRKTASPSYGWQDDRTLVAYHRDRGGFQVVVRDCPPEHADGYPLPPLEYLPRGPENAVLGTTRAALLKQWGVVQEEIAEDGALVLRPAAPNPADALLVWFDRDQVARVVARHREAPTANAGPAAWGQAVLEAWARDLRTLGWPRRQDQTARGVLQSLAWQDERTRVHIFWQENDGGSAAVFTEWKALSNRGGP